MQNKGKCFILTTADKIYCENETVRETRSERKGERKREREREIDRQKSDRQR